MTITEVIKELEKLEDMPYRHEIEKISLALELERVYKKMDLPFEYSSLLRDEKKFREYNRALNMYNCLAWRLGEEYTSEMEIPFQIEVPDPPNPAGAADLKP